MEKAPRTENRDRAFGGIVAAATRAPMPSGTRMLLLVRSAEWGEILIELIVKGSEVHARVHTECDAARDAMLSQLDELRTSLEDRGLRLGEFRVNVGPGHAAAEEPAACGPRSVRPQTLDLVV